MKLDKDKTMLVLRVNDFQSIHFIEAHQDLINRHGTVWMLKAGRSLASKSLSTIKNEGNYLILKEPKKAGGRYYFCHILDVYEGPAKKDMVYPSYYQQLDSVNISLRGTWLLIEGIIPINEDVLDYIVLVKGGKRMTEIVNSTRSPILFVKSLIDLIEVQGIMCQEGV